MKTKVCNQCKKEKPEDCFYVRQSVKQGERLSSKCRLCCIENSGKSYLRRKVDKSVNNSVKTVN